MAKATAKNNEVKRDYSCSDSNMLTASAVLVTNAATGEVKTFLVSKRANWKDPYLSDLQDKINKAFKEVLGIDSLGDQTKSSAALYKAMDEIRPKLSAFKVQVEADFEDDNREKEILNSLGFKLFAKVQKGSQEALVELLSMFSLNMTDGLQKEIVAEGTDVSYITEIKSFADVIRDKNVMQETKKGSKKTVTANGITELNAIYKEVIKVAKIASGLYTEMKDVANAGKFSFAKIVQTLSNKPGGTGGSKTAPATT